jgi:hypothetical protein
LHASGKDATWVSWDHPLHGYIFPITGADGTVEVDDVQERAIDGVIEFLDKHLGGWACAPTSSSLDAPS